MLHFSDNLRQAVCAITILQNAAEGGVAPRKMIPTAVICCPYVLSPQLLYPPRPHI